MKTLDFIPQASVKVGGKLSLLNEGVKEIGNLKVGFDLKTYDGKLHDWTVYLKNDGKENSLPITEFYGLNIFIPLGENQPLTYNGIKGDNNSVESYSPVERSIAVGDRFTQEPQGGRSADTTAFPYFDITSPEFSLVCGIGWSGQWFLTVTRSKEGVTLTAGQRDCDIVLYPEEKIRSVRILLVKEQASVIKTRQDFVDLHRRYASPLKDKGDGYVCPIAMQAFDRYFWSANVADGTPYFETEEAQIKICETAGKCGCFNTHWVDACWFKDTFRNGVGNYSEYSSGFPNGLKPVADSAHANGMKFIVWFEPFRAFKGTEAWKKFEKNPKQLVRLPDCDEALLNLGDDEVRNWIYSQIVKVIEENGIDYYRQDFNINSPYVSDFLRSIEEKGRYGLAQMRFVEGIYKLWDALFERFPNLIIDNCASGGRLLDAETCSRAFSLWQSDTAGRDETDGYPTSLIQQNQNLMLSRYIPHHQGASFEWDAYRMRSAATYGISCEFPFLDDGFDVDSAKTALLEVKEMSRYWKGDFTPLTGYSKESDVFSAYSLKLSEKEGMIAVFRRHDVKKDVFVLNVGGFDEKSLYSLTFVDEERKRKSVSVNGKDFCNLEVKIDKAPGSVLIFWEKCE